MIIDASMYVGMVLHVRMVMNLRMCTCMYTADPCKISNGGCDSKRKCTNTAGSRACGTCPSGWTNDGDTECKGISLFIL